MLSYEHKRTIFQSFNELKEVSISNNRRNFVYPASRKPGKIVIRELQHSGNGYVCGRYMAGYQIDSRGWINIKNFDEVELREVVRKAIESMSR